MVSQIKFLSAAFLLTQCACGLQPGGTSGVAPNEDRPNATLLAQGALNGQNGQSVSGSALVFRYTANSYVLRLENLSAPSGVTFQARVYTTLSASPVFTRTLTFNSGNQNFNFSTATSGIFSKVDIVNPAILGAGATYGSALLLQAQVSLRIHP